MFNTRSTIGIWKESQLLLGPYRIIELMYFLIICDATPTHIINLAVKLLMT